MLVVISHQSTGVSLLLIADDILLVVPTVTGLQLFFTTFERELEQLNMRVNGLKSMCIRSERDLILLVLN
jgi:hypothetical protein